MPAARAELRTLARDVVAAVALVVDLEALAALIQHLEADSLRN